MRLPQRFIKAGQSLRQSSVRQSAAWFLKARLATQTSVKCTMHQRYDD